MNLQLRKFKPETITDDRVCVFIGELDSQAERLWVMAHTHMKKEQLLGLSRELLGALGGALATFGVSASGSQIETVTGLVMVLISIVWALKANEGKEVLFTLFRKALSVAGGVGVAFGLLTPEKLEALIAVVAPIIALVWSFHSKGGNLPAGVSAILLFLCLGFISTAAIGCAGLGPIGVTADGCILQSYDKDGQKFKAGVCVDDQGKINRGRVQWENDTGDLIRLTTYKGTGSSLLEYRVAEGVWIRWSSKSGVMLGVVPDTVRPAIDDGYVSPEQIQRDLEELL
jgi:hypothetical protein